MRQKLTGLTETPNSDNSAVSRSLSGAAPTAGSTEATCCSTAGKTAAAGRFSPEPCVPAPLVAAQPSLARPPWLSAICQRSSTRWLSTAAMAGDRSAHRDCSAQSASRYAAVPAVQHDSLRPRLPRFARGSIPCRVDPGARRVHPIMDHAPDPLVVVACTCTA